MTITAPAPAAPQSDTITIELSNTCRCVICDTCHIGYNADDGDGCDECDGPLTPYDCYGECYTESTDDLAAEFDRWTAHNRGYKGTYIVSTEGFGWNNMPIVRIYEPVQHGDPTRPVAPDCEWTQTWNIPTGKGEITVVQYHHDSPTGEVWIVRPATREDHVRAGV